MKLIKKLTAVLLVCIMALSFTACHQKGEIAVTVNGYEFTSAYYMCAFLNAYSEGQQLVTAELSEEAQQEEIDYTKQKIEGKKFETWVRDTAIEAVKKNANFKKLCEEKKIKLSEEDIKNNEEFASFYWESYGLKQFYEPNGVSYETFLEFTNDESLATVYFENVYGKKGEKEIPAKTVKAKLKKDFALADILDFTVTEENKSTLKSVIKTFKKYADEIESGKKTFEEVYNEYNKVEEHEDHEGHDEEAESSYQSTTVGADGTGHEHEYYDDIKKMKTDEVKVIEKDEDQGCLLVVKRDIMKDEIHLDSMDTEIRHLLKDDEFNKDMEEAAKKLKADVNNFAIKQFKVKKIVEPNYQ